MGLSSSKTTSSTEPWKAAQPHILGAAGALGNTYNANADDIQMHTDQVTRLLPGMIEKYQAGNPAVNAAQNYNTDVLSGRYLNADNPYLSAITDQVANQARNQTAGALGVKGLTGGSDYTRLVSQGVANAVTPLLYNNYTNERNAMAGAASQAPGLAAADAIQIAPMLSTLQAGLTPIQAASGYSGAIGGLLSPYSTTTQKQSGGLLGSLLGAATSIGSAGLLGGRF